MGVALLIYPMCEGHCNLMVCKLLKPCIFFFDASLPMLAYVSIKISS